jgi:hypothetical protein
MQMVQSMAERGWEESAIYRPYHSFPDELAKAPEVHPGLKHSFFNLVLRRDPTLP